MPAERPMVGQSLDAHAYAQNLHGDADWMKEAEFNRLGLGGSRGVILGQRLNGDLVRYDGDGHIMVFSPTGGGKGIGFVQPNLAEYQGSMVVLDPKGENAIVSAELRRRMGQEVIILDPFGMTGFPSDTFNPLSALTYADSASVGPRIELLAQTLIRDEGAREQQWVLGARKFGTFLMWWMVAHEPPERRNLMRFFELVHGGYNLLGKMATVMSEGRSPDPEIARLCKALGTWFRGRTEREFSYFESICINQMGWVGDFVWKDVLGSAPSPPPPLKTKAVTIYLVLPFHHLERYQAWLRLMVADLITALYDTPGVPNHEPVLFLLDEAYAGLGRMQFLFTAAAAVRSAGARLVFVYQDISQVAELYRDAWQSLIANSGVTLFWAVNDLKAAQHLSTRCGQRTATVPGSPGGMAQPLIRPETILGLGNEEIIALFRNASPARFGRLNVLTDKRFSSKLAANRTYGAAREKPTTARTGFVPVDLDAVSGPKRKDDDGGYAYGLDDGDVDAPKSNAHLVAIAEQTGLPLPLLEQLEAEHGRLVLRGDTLGFINKQGTFEGLISRG